MRKCILKDYDSAEIGSSSNEVIKIKNSEFYITEGGQDCAAILTKDSVHNFPN